MPAILSFGEARAAAGILLLMSVVAAINAALLDNFLPMRLVITLFFVDFARRVLVPVVATTDPPKRPTMAPAPLTVPAVIG